MKHNSARMVLLLVLAVIMIAAAPVNRNYYVDVGEVTIDSQYSGNWEPVDSLVVVTSDSGTILVTISGTAVLDPWDKLYIGLGNDSANRVDSATSATTGQVNPNLDTVLMRPDDRQIGKAYVPFSVTIPVDNDGATDTLYLNMATGGSSSSEKVYIEDLFFIAAVSDQNE